MVPERIAYSTFSTSRDLAEGSMMHLCIKSHNRRYNLILHMLQSPRVLALIQLQCVRTSIDYSVYEYRLTLFRKIIVS
jgi:hypothetical protein